MVNQGGEVDGVGGGKESLNHGAVSVG
jgi:hypothetical protein